MQLTGTSSVSAAEAHIDGQIDELCAEIAKIENMARIAGVLNLQAPAERASSKKDV
jgi:hypothetical protein